MIDFKDEERLLKIEKKSYNESLRLIYEWIKKRCISFKNFPVYLEKAQQNKNGEESE